MHLSPVLKGYLPRIPLKQSWQPQFSGSTGPKSELAAAFFQHPAEAIMQGHVDAIKQFLEDFNANYEQLKNLSIVELQTSFDLKQLAILLTRLYIDKDLPADNNRAKLMVNLKIAGAEQNCSYPLRLHLSKVLYSH